MPPSSSCRSILGPRYDRAARPYISLDSTQKRALDALRKAVEFGEIELERTDCPICHSSKSDRIASTDRYLLPICHDLCVDCGLVYSSRRLAAKSAGLFFNKYYVPLHGGANRTNDEYFRNQRHHGGFVFQFVQPVFRPGMHVVEFGCGPGGILSVFADEGAIVTGYELNTAFTLNRPEGWPPVLVGTVETALERPARYDLVVLPHLLNLLFDPLDVLKKVRLLLKDGGFLYVEVPGLRSYDKGHYSLCGNMSAHPYRRDLMRGLTVPQNFYFESSVIRYLLSEAGFDVVSSTELVRVLAKTSSALPSSVDARRALSGNYERNCEYLKRVEALRKRYAPVSSAAAIAGYPFRLATRMASRLTAYFGADKRQWR